MDTIVCILCRQQFNDNNKLPCTQLCHHSVCFECIDKEKETLVCPLDSKQYSIVKFPNRPLCEYLGLRTQPLCQLNEPSPEGLRVELGLKRFATLLRHDLLGMNGVRLSPQMRRKLLLLIQSTYHLEHARCEFLRRVASVFNRLLLELVQAHFNTKQREQDLIRLVNSKGCNISEPELTNIVIDLLVKLYKAAGQCADTSFERNVLVKFLLKELGENRYNKRQVERVLQTLYRCSCFHISTRDQAPGRLKLKDDLCSSNELRQQVEVEIIKLAQLNRIRLSADSWAYILRQRSCPGNVAMFQSLLDKYQDPVSVSELQDAVAITGDKYGMLEKTEDLLKIEDMISCAESSQSIEISVLADIVDKLTESEHLFTVRQHRGKTHR